MSVLRKLSLLVLVPLATITLVGCGTLNLSNRFTAEEEVAKNFTVAKAPRVIAETFNGSVDVMVMKGSTVVAKVTKRCGGSSQEAAEDDLENMQVEMVQEGDTVRITARQANQRPFTNRGARIELQVPVASVLELRTSNGKVVAEGPASDVTAQSSNGTIQVVASTGRLDLTTSNGSIAVNGGRGEVTAKTSNGGIDIKSHNATVKAQTSNGNIQFKGGLAEGENSFQSSNGKIALRLPPDCEFSLDANTSHGKITSDFSLKQAGGKSTKTRLRGTVGENPATTIKAHTSNGAIEIREEK